MLETDPKVVDVPDPEPDAEESLIETHVDLLAEPHHGAIVVFISYKGSLISEAA